MTDPDDDLLAWLTAHDFVVDETELDDPWPDLDVGPSTLSAVQLGYLDSLAAPLDADVLDAVADVDPSSLGIEPIEDAAPIDDAAPTDGQDD